MRRAQGCQLRHECLFLKGNQLAAKTRSANRSQPSGRPKALASTIERNLGRLGRTATIDSKNSVKRARLD
jgi:hypothetical protein